MMIAEETPNLNFADRANMEDSGEIDSVDFQDSRAWRNTDDLKVTGNEKRFSCERRMQSESEEIRSIKQSDSASHKLDSS